ncbi:MAG TPA: glycosyltransferase 87 family protein [Thermoanaerobaculia bacterium]|nr:glycosyltransferase 87 family protein [Thermoanaerobaculia bacterium]
MPLAVQAIALGVLAAAGDPTRRPLLTLALLGVGCAALVALVRGAARAAVSPAAILGAAALLRLLLLPLPPALSSDVWRYLWEGRVAAHRGNPYLQAPDDPALTPLRDELWTRVQHRAVPSVYPPLAMSLFVLPSGLPLGAAVIAWKLIVALGDLAGCALLLRLAAARGLPRHRVLWYAAHPLAVLEGAGMGHVEPLGVAAAVLAVLLLVRRRPTGAGAAAAAAGLLKVAPFAALPMWIRQARELARADAAELDENARRAGARGDDTRRAGRNAAWLFAVAAIGLAAIALLPALLAAGGIPAGLVTYTLRWEFGGPLHEPLWRLLAAAHAPEAVKHALDLMKEWTGMHALWNRAYPWAYPQLISRLLLALVAAAVVLRSALSRRGPWRDPVRGTAALFAGLLVCSPTVYPWYLLWVLPWAALAGSATWIAAATTAPLLYLPALLAVPLWPWVFVTTWAPVGLVWVGERWRARRTRQ